MIAKGFADVSPVMIGTAEFQRLPELAPTIGQRAARAAKLLSNLALTPFGSIPISVLA
jgi:hypothetical protein